jgi:hypothetical protein
MHHVLTEVVRSVFPLTANPDQHIAEHVWRDRNYVGEINGRVAAWKGFRVNLRKIDFRYRGTYIDLVDNSLPLDEQIRLFGPAFVDATRDYHQYVVLFVLDFPKTAEKHIQEHGFIPRRMPTGKILHACKIVGVDEFLSTDHRVWISHFLQLIILQRFLSIHRRPFEENELPLQHLLFQTGYLHRYLIENGLVLHQLSQPRRTGHFGHDFHALVSHPRFLLNTPFPVGVEVYVGSLGYHQATIPEYVAQFDLKGVIVIAKDDPFLWLKDAWKLSQPIIRANQLIELATDTGIGVHHIPLEQIMIDFSDLRSRFDEILPIPS